MKTLTALTIAAVASIAFSGNVSALKIHTLEDVHKNDRKSASSQRPSAINDLSFIAQVKSDLNSESDSSESFSGKGHKLGGDRYVNRILGINHKEGKRLARLNKKHGKKRHNSI